MNNPPSLPPPQPHMYPPAQNPQFGQPPAQHPHGAPPHGVHLSQGQPYPQPMQGYPQGYPQQQGYPQGYPQQQGHPQGYPQQQGHPQGYPQQQGYPQPINIVVQNTNTMSQNAGGGALVRVANRSKWVAAVLAFFLGGLGVHKFYLGQTGMGLMYLLFCWTFIPLFISLVETLMLVVASEREFDVRFNSQLAR